jgi:hypothetical protein
MKVFFQEGRVIMNISSVNINSNNVLYSANDNEIKMLENQKAKVQEQIQKAYDSDMDDKVKLERINMLKEQIQEIDTQIQQKRMEKLNQNKAQNQNESQNQNQNEQTSNGNLAPVDNGLSSDLVSMTNLIQAGYTYSNTKVINSTKNNLIGKGNVLKQEIKLDENRGGSAEKKRAELFEIESRKKTLTKKEAEAIQTAQNQVEKAAKTKSENDDEDNAEGKNTNKDKNYTGLDIRL